MGRISKYKNELTESSNLKIEEFCTRYKSIMAEQIEQFQTKYGISDATLAKAVGIDRSAISRFKTGKYALSDTTLSALYFLFKEFPNVL